MQILVLGRDARVTLLKKKLNEIMKLNYKITQC